MSVFFLVSHKTFCEPLIPEFLFGEYSRNTEAACFGNMNPDEVAFISKNICRSPKIIGYPDWIVTEQCKKFLDDHVAAKWRTVVIKEPFAFEWHEKDGFEILDELHEIQRREFLKQGKAEHEIDDLISTDPGLAYREFVSRFRVSNFETQSRYFELVAQYSTVATKTKEYSDVVAFDLESGGTVFLKSQPESTTLFSLTALSEYGILSLGSGKHAITFDVFSKVKDFLEPKYFSTVAVDFDTVIEVA